MGDTQDVSVFGGYGDLDENGFNIFGVVDYRHGNDVMAKDRKVSKRGGLLPELGITKVAVVVFLLTFMTQNWNRRKPICSNWMRE